MERFKNMLDQLCPTSREQVAGELVTLYLKELFSRLRDQEKEEIILYLSQKPAHTYPGIQIDLGSSIITLPLGLAEQNTLACLLRDRKMIDLDGKSIVRSQVSYHGALDRSLFQEKPQMERDLQRAIQWYRDECKKKC